MEIQNPVNCDEADVQSVYEHSMGNIPRMTVSITADDLSENSVGEITPQSYTAKTLNMANVLFDDGQTCSFDDDNAVLYF